MCLTFEYFNTNGISVELVLPNATTTLIYQDTHRESHIWKKGYVTFAAETQDAHLVFSGTMLPNSNRQYVLVIDNIELFNYSCHQEPLTGKQCVDMKSFLQNQDCQLPSLAQSCSTILDN